MLRRWGCAAGLVCCGAASVLRRCECAAGLVCCGAGSVLRGWCAAALRVCCGAIAPKVVRWGVGSLGVMVNTAPGN